MPPRSPRSGAEEALRRSPTGLACDRPRNGPRRRLNTLGPLAGLGFGVGMSWSTTSSGAVPSMDAKQVWRAALGELQVSLSPANFETWLKDTALVAVDDNRFRVAVPNGFAKDWLETRYRSLISQTLARVVGYSVNVDFEVREVSASERADGGHAAAAKGATGGGDGAADSLQSSAAPLLGARLQPVARAPGPRPPRARSRRRPRGSAVSLNAALHVPQLHRRLGQPPRPRGKPVRGRTSGPRLQPALPVRRRRARQDAPDARDRQCRDRPLPAQARRLRDQREVHQRVHHLHPAGPDRRLPQALSAHRPAAHRRHPVHRRQGADPGRVLPHLQRHPRGRQADRPLERPTAQADHDARGAPAQPLRVGSHRRPDAAGPGDAHRHPARQGGGAGRAHRLARRSSSSPARSSPTSASSKGALNRIVAYANMQGMPITLELAQAVLSNVLYNPKKRAVTPEQIAQAVSEYYGVDSRRSRARSATGPSSCRARSRCT